TRADLPLLGDELPQHRDVLVVDLVDLVLAVRARLAPAAAGGASLVAPSYRTPALLGHCCLPLERDVVLRRAARRGGRGLEVAVVDRNVAPHGELGAAAAVAGVVAAAEELHRIGNDIHCLALLAVLRLPLAPLEAAVERDRTALGEVASAVLALRAPHGHVEVVGLVLPLAGGVVLPAR